jgi:O-antigen ligase
MPVFSCGRWAALRSRNAVPAVVAGLVIGLLGVLPVGAAVGAALALIVVSVTGPASKGPSVRVRQVFWVATGFLVAAVSSTLATGPGPETFVPLGRFSLFPLAVLAVSRLRGHDASLSLWLGATLGASLAGMVAAAEVLVTDVRRPSGFGNPILFGGLALVLAAVSVLTAPLVEDRFRAARRWSVVAGGLGVLASLLAQARGSWLALPVLAGIAVVAHRRRGGSPRVVVAAGLVLSVLIPAGLIANEGAGLDAFGRAVDQAADYTLGDRDTPTRSSSVGSRFEMWGSALDAFGDSPYLGVGWGRLHERFVVDVLEGLRPVRVAGFDHAHNQFVGTLASGGLVGFAAFLAVLVVPLRMFGTAFRDGGHRGALGAAGLAVVCGFAVMSLTEAVFEREPTLVFYAVAVALLATQLDRLDAGPTPDTPMEAEHTFV